MPLLLSEQPKMHVGSSVVTNVSLWWGMPMMGEAMHVQGKGYVHGKPLHLPLSFAVNLKLL